MATKLSKALNAASHPAVRARAAATTKRNTKIRHKFAAQFNEPPDMFLPKNILATLKRREIALGDVPPELLKSQSPKARERFENGGGVGIPLDAIPERAPRANGKARGAYGSKLNGKHGHPNGDLIAKTIDLLGREGTTDAVAERLLAVLDKLVA